MSGFDAKTSKEDAGKRTATSKTFTNADGSSTVDYFAAPVNYTAADGSVQPIDPTLVAAPATAPAAKSGSSASSSAGSLAGSSAVAGTSAAGRLVRKAGDASVSLAASGTDPALMTVGSGSASLSFALSGAAAVPAATKGTQATYPSILPGVDLTLQATTTGVEQTLVLASASAATDYVFPYTVAGV
ncbi:hypothetical protein ACFQ9X_30485 [Catenulispora yoronensis]